MNGPPPPVTDEGSLWDDGKEPGALRTIGEVAQALAIKQHVLRYWEDQFPMLRPLKRSGGRRYYRPEDIALVRRIDQLVHRAGYTLRGARIVLEAEPRGSVQPAPPGPSAPEPPVTPNVAIVFRETSGDATLERLRTIRARLASALAG